MTELDLELQQLRRENAELRKERDLSLQAHAEMCAKAERLQADYEILAKMYAKVNEDLCVRTNECDALMKDLKATASCDVCKNANSKCEQYLEIGELGLNGLCGGEHWEWRGIDGT